MGNQQTRDRYFENLDTVYFILTYLRALGYGTPLDFEDRFLLLMASTRIIQRSAGRFLQDPEVIEFLQKWGVDDEFLQKLRIDTGSQQETKQIDTGSQIETKQPNEPTGVRLMRDPAVLKFLQKWGNDTGSPKQPNEPTGVRLMRDPAVLKFLQKWGNDTESQKETKESNEPTGVRLRY